MTEKILFVDDESQLLQAIERQLRKRFLLLTAESGAEALQIMETEGPFAVIVSDMRMPGMDGVQLLARVRELYPDTVRLMLTGNADQETAVEAVNKGQVFRFLNKPCSTAVLVPALAFALRQYKLLTAEKELLNKTLKGSITVMAELLSLSNATAFSSGYRIRPMVKKVAEELHLPNPWQYEVAALMSQIGCITLPSDILNKLHAGITLSLDEQEMYNNHPKVGARLLRKIPRLEKVALMIEQQLSCAEEQVAEDEEVAFGAELLRAAIDYDLLRQQELSHSRALKRMRKREPGYRPEILELMEKHRPKLSGTEIHSVRFQDVVPGMYADEDVFAKNGTLLIPKNQEITWSIIQSLTNFEKHIGIMEPIRVRRNESVEEGHKPIDLT